MDVKTLIEKLSKLEPDALVYAEKSIITIEGKEVVEIVVGEPTNVRYANDLLKKLMFNTDGGFDQFYEKYYDEIENYKTGDLSDNEFIDIISEYLVGCPRGTTHLEHLTWYVLIEGYLTEEGKTFYHPKDETDEKH